MGEALTSFFRNPAMLFGAFAVAAPIIIFLLTRFRHRTVDWAALTFLQRALKRQQRRLRLENLLLLLIRCLIVLLFVLALARPQAAGDVALNEEDTNKNVVLLVDTSYSTGYQVGSDQEETSYQRARRAAKDLVKNGLADGDRVAVIAFDDHARPLYPKPRQINERVRKEVLQDLEDAPELQLSQRGTDLSEALHTLPRLLDAFDRDAGGGTPPPGAAPTPKTVFVFTDAQRLGLLDGTGQAIDRTLPAAAAEIKAKGGALVLIDCGPDEPKNVTVARLETREPVVGQDIPTHVEAVIRNSSGDEIKDLTVEYFVDGAPSPQKVVSLDVPGNEEVTPDPLRYTFSEPGLHRVEVHVKSDALAIDNRRHLVIDVREGVKVLLVDGERARERWESETDFVREVLALSMTGDEGPGLLRPEVVDESEIAARELPDYDVVFVCNVVALSDESATALERYARNGGAVVFTMGALVDAQAYNETLWRRGLGLFPCELLEPRGGTRAEAATDETASEWVMTLGEVDDHPASLFRDEEMATWLRMSSIFGFYAVDLGSAQGTSPARVGDGADGERGGDGGEAGGVDVAQDHPVTVPIRVVPRPADDDVGPTAGDPAAAGGPPLLVEKRFGRGRVSVWLTTVDYHWNNCVLYDGFYLPFWRQLTQELAQGTRPPLNLPIGGRYERLLRAEEFAARTEVETPDGRRETVVLGRAGNQELYRLTFPRDDERGGLQESGIYTVTREGLAGGGGDSPPGYFAVGIDPAEGDLAKFDAEALQFALGVPVRPMAPDSVRAVLEGEGAVGGTQEYWREALAAVIALLVLESVLAAVFGRRRR